MVPIVHCLCAGWNLELTLDFAARELYNPNSTLLQLDSSLLPAHMNQQKEFFLWMTLHHRLDMRYNFNANLQ
jgi:hypothetical protein